MKPWNVDMDLVTEYEKLFYDYKDEQKQEILMIKLKTNRINSWVQFYEYKYDRTSQYHDWETKPGKTELLRIKNRAKVKVTIKFHLTSGIITIQGNGCKEWAEVEFPQMLKSLNDFTNTDTTNRNTIQDAKPIDQLCEDEEVLIDKEKEFSATPDLKRNQKSNLRESNFEDDLEKVIENRSIKLLSTPTTPQNIINKHFESTETRLNNLESTVKQDREENTILREFVEKSMKSVEEVLQKIDTISEYWKEKKTDNTDLSNQVHNQTQIIKDLNVEINEKDEKIKKTSETV